MYFRKNRKKPILSNQKAEQLANKATDLLENQQTG